MSNSALSKVLSKIYQESALSDSRDSLLNFNTKSLYQTPLVMEAGDLFYEKWVQASGPLPLDSFLPQTSNFTPQQKLEVKEHLFTALKEKVEDFGSSDLYLMLGFLKWEGNALSPSLLIPVDVNLQNQTVSLSTRPPVENVVLRERLNAQMNLPTVEDATLGGKFSVLLYFSLFEKAVAAEKNWKFTRHGICLSFLDSTRLGLKKCLERGLDESNESAAATLQALFSPEGFQTKESIFDTGDFDKIYSPLDHYPLYITDSHSTKVTIDALDPECSAYAIQALPGTAKIKTAANIAAESIANKKKTLVVYRRACSGQEFRETLFPLYRNFNGPERNVLHSQLQSAREGFLRYYQAVCNDIQPANAPLSELLAEFVQNPAVKIKSSESLFQELGKVSYQNYQEIKADLEEIVYLYFDKKGKEARNAFKSVRVPSLGVEEQEATAKELALASSKVSELKPLISLVAKTGLFPTGIYLSGLADIIDLILANFNRSTPVFEDWELRSSNWEDYQDSLKALPEAGDKWVRYRRQTSDIYTDNAVDENILSIREDFAESLKATLKGLSDRYRNSKKKLLKVLKDPKSVSSDSQLLDLIDTLIELQENKRAYKDTSVLGNHLLGKDWLYERSNWFELNKKITYIYDFRESHKNDARMDLLLQILEQWHLFKDALPQMKDYAKTVRELQEVTRKITRSLSLETPLESLCIEKWLDEIEQWNANWGNLETHIRITSLLQSIESRGAKALCAYLSDAENVNRNIAQAFAHFWAGTQIQQVGKEAPELFSLLPKARAQKTKDYRTQLDQFCNANFRLVHDTVKENPDYFTCVPLEQSFYLDSAKTFDLVIFLDADCITAVQALPAIFKTKKTVLIGDPHAPLLEYLPLDGYSEDLTPHTGVFQESILTMGLRQGIPTRELWFSSTYTHPSLIDFANCKIYGGGIHQLPQPSREGIKNQTLKVVGDKIMETAKAAIRHAEKNPGRTLGIVAFHQSTCQEIWEAICGLVPRDSAVARFFQPSNPAISFYVKTPERAAGRLRDSIIVCAEYEPTEKKSINQKLSVCTTLARQDLQVFLSEQDMAQKPSQKPDLFWEWVLFLQKVLVLDIPEEHPKESALYAQSMEALQNENIQVEPAFSQGGIAVGPVVVDANNPKRFLAMVEDDCTTERFRESIEDRIYVRHTLLRQLGWKVLNLWTPFWYMAFNDEVSHMVTTIAIEQSVAPPPKEGPEGEAEEETENEMLSAESLGVVPYTVLHPKIEGTIHSKPIPELPVASLITQLKFYVDHESPIHEELLKQRLAELHKEVWPNPQIAPMLTEALKQGLKNQKFIQTGKFFYSIKNQAVSLRDRSLRPNSERKLIYVSPEERMFIPTTVDEREIKQLLGLLE
jgi:hypothetical protein